MTPIAYELMPIKPVFKLSFIADYTLDVQNLEEFLYL